MTTKAHTPTPWTLGAVPEEPGTYIIGANRVFFCRVVSSPEHDGLANAAFIVKACNAHAPLVEALKAMLETHGMHGPCKMNSCSDCKYAAKKAQSALAAVEG